MQSNSFNPIKFTLIALGILIVLAFIPPMASIASRSKVTKQDTILNIASNNNRLIKENNLRLHQIIENGEK
jgi:hypothetical protein